MLNRHYDEVFIGTSYLSLLKAIKSQSSGKSVLLINEPKVKYGVNWISHFGELEKQMLKQSFLTLSCSDLGKKIDSFLKPVGLELHLDELRVRLTDSPYENMFELCRKIPELFSPDVMKILTRLDEKTFNGRCLTFIKTIAKEINTDNHSYYKNILLQISCELEEIFSIVKANLFSENISKETVRRNRQFLFALQASFQNTFGRSFLDIEIDYLLIQLISYRYHVSQDRLNQALISKFKQIGGQLKSTRIQQWQVHRNRLENILLASYEGVISPQKTYFMGEIEEGLPFTIGKDQSLFKSIKMSLHLKKTAFRGRESMDVFLVQKDKLGTSFPLIHLCFIDQYRCEFNFAYRFQEGSRPEHYLERAKLEMIRFFSTNFPELKEQEIIVNSTFSPGDYIWVENTDDKEISSLKVEKGTFEQSSTDVYSREGTRPLQDVSYLGPLDGRPLGLLSYMV